MYEKNFNVTTNALTFLQNAFVGEDEKKSVFLKRNIIFFRAVSRVYYTYAMLNSLNFYVDV